MTTDEIIVSERLIRSFLYGLDGRGFLPGACCIYISAGIINRLIARASVTPVAARMPTCLAGIIEWVSSPSNPAMVVSPLNRIGIFREPVIDFTVSLPVRGMSDLLSSWFLETR